MKPFLFIVFWLLEFIVFTSVFADNLPTPIKLWLPFEGSSSATAPVVSIIKETIKYVGVLAIVSLSWWGIQFMLSIGDDGKVKKAKSIVLYALLGVILSITAYAIIDVINSLRI